MLERYFVRQSLVTVSELISTFHLYKILDTGLEKPSRKSNESKKLSSAIADDAFFIIKKANLRALAVCDVNLTKALIRQLSGLLDSDWFKPLHQKSIQGLTLVDFESGRYSQLVQCFIVL